MTQGILNRGELNRALLTGLYLAYPDWKICEQDFTLPKQGDTANVAFVGQDYVIKSIHGTPVSNAALSVEAWFLRQMTREMNAQKMTAHELMGVDVPTYIEPRDDQMMTSFVMARIPGKVRAEAQKYATHPDVIDQLSRFVIQLDHVIAKGINELETGPHDKLDAYIVAGLERYAEITRNNSSLLPGLDHDVLKIGEKAMMDLDPGMKKHLDRAHETMDKILRRGLGPCRIMHGDFHAENMLLDIERDPNTNQPKHIRVGVLDFGLNFYGDPHVGFAQMLSVTGAIGQEMILKLIDQVNEHSLKETGTAWADPADCLALAPLAIAKSLGWSIQNGGGMDPTCKSRHLSQIKEIRNRLETTVIPEMGTVKPGSPSRSAVPTWSTGGCRNGG